MKKTIIILFILNSILFADLSKIIHLPNKSKILSLTFRYIGMNGNIQTQQLRNDIYLTKNGIFLTQAKEEHFVAKIDIQDISRINSFIIEYEDEFNNKFFKPIYYSFATLMKDKPLYIYEKDSMMHKNMKQNKNMPLMPNMDNMANNRLIDGFTLGKFKQTEMESGMQKTKVMKFKKYNLDYINKTMHPVMLDGMDISKKEKHFCTIPIRDNIFYFVDKKALFVIFKDFELTSGMSIENNKVTIRFEQENKFRPCVLNNINKNIIKMSSYYEEHNNGEAWFNVHFASNIKSASIVYPKEKSDIMAYDEELKDIIVYKIEY